MLIGNEIFRRCEGGATFYNVCALWLKKTVRPVHGPQARGFTDNCPESARSGPAPGRAARQTLTACGFALLLGMMPT